MLERLRNAAHRVDRIEPCIIGERLPRGPFRTNLGNPAQDRQPGRYERRQVVHRVLLLGIVGRQGLEADEVLIDVRLRLVEQRSVRIHPADGKTTRFADRPLKVRLQPERLQQHVLGVGHRLRVLLERGQARIDGERDDASRRDTQATKEADPGCLEARSLFRPMRFLDCTAQCDPLLNKLQHATGTCSLSGDRTRPDTPAIVCWSD